MTQNIEERPKTARRGPRLKLRREITLHWQEGDTRHQDATYTILLSQFGCSLRASINFRPGTPVTVEYEGKSRSGKVVYTLLDYSTNHAEVGVAFEQDASDFWNMRF